MSESVSITKFKNDKRLKEKAKKLLNNKEELSKLLNDAYKIVSKKGAFEDILHKVQLFISLVKDYVRGNYREISTLKIILIVASLIYLVSPLDFIPDNIPGVGHVDDIAILKFVYKSTKEELEEYGLWKENVAIAV